MKSSPINLIGIAAWKFVPSQPRHNTFHQAISQEAIKRGLSIQYLGLKNTHKADWVNQVLPDTVLKRIPYISPLQLYRILRSLPLAKKSKNVIYMFEGSFTWSVLLSLVSRLIPNTSVVCNLFPSSKYSKILNNKNGLRPIFSAVFLIFSKFSWIHLTFDTRLMSESVNQSIGREQFKNIFPLPSALPYLEEKQNISPLHYKILVNMRDFNLAELHELVSGSCQECTFVFPRGFTTSTPLWYEFGDYSNLSFDETNIAVEDYLDYVDQFDYMIFLYNPSIDSSGKLLDALVRRKPVCLPRESTEWCSIAANFGSVHQYDFTSLDGKKILFNHPIFSESNSTEIPQFTPAGAIENLSKYASRGVPNTTIVNITFQLISGFLITLHWIVASVANLSLSLVSRTAIKLLKIKLF
jgi:hypothetical protein